METVEKGGTNIIKNYQLPSKSVQNFINQKVTSNVSFPLLYGYGFIQTMNYA